MKEGCGCIGCFAFLIANIVVATIIGLILTVLIIAALASAS